VCELRFKDLQLLDGVRFVNCQKLLATNPVLSRINTDSRTLKPGEIFWALKGDRFDGHDFVQPAAQNGARFAVVNYAVQTREPFPQVVVPDTLKALQQLAKIKRSKFKGTVVGLTGSNGKTTTKEMIAHVLSSKQKVHKTVGNLNNHIGCPLTLLELQPEHRTAVIELGTNHPGEIALLTEITDPDLALVTNVGPAHLEFFGTLDEVAREKISLFDGLSDGKTVFINLNDPYLKKYRREGLKKVTFAFDEKADVTGKILRVERNGNCVFRLNDKVDIYLRTPGVHNAYNALSAAAVALFLGMNENEIKDALESYSAFEKRMQVQEYNGIRIINDAYNANPESVKAAFETLKQMERSDGLLLVLGDMFELGEESLHWHEAALKGALSLNPDFIYVMGKFMEQAAEKIGKDKIAVFESHEHLARALKEKMRPGSLVFIKGSRGMRMEKVLEYI